MVNPTLTYDNEYNRRLADILSNYDDIQASSNPPTMVVGGMKDRKYINSGNTPYDGREGTAHFSGAMYGGSCGECQMCGSAMSGGVNRMKKAKKWREFAKDTAEMGLDLFKKIKGGSVSGGAISGGQVSGGVNRMKKAKKWREFAKDTAEMGLDLFKKIKGGAKSGGQVSGGVNRLKKAKKWREFAKDTAMMGLDLFKKIKGGAKSGGKQMIEDGAFLPKPKTARATGYGRPANPWIQHVKAYQAQHGVSYKEAMKLAKSTYR